MITIDNEATNKPLASRLIDRRISRLLSDGISVGIFPSCPFHATFLGVKCFLQFNCLGIPTKHSRIFNQFSRRSLNCQKLAMTRFRYLNGLIVSRFYLLYCMPYCRIISIHYCSDMTVMVSCIIHPLIGIPSCFHGPFKS